MFKFADFKFRTITDIADVGKNLRGNEVFVNVHFLKLGDPEPFSIKKQRVIVTATEFFFRDILLFVKARENFIDVYFYNVGKWNEVFVNDRVFRFPSFLYLSWKGFYMVHAAAFELNGKYGLLIGQSGAGKTYASNKMKDSGVKIFDDELNFVRFENNTLFLCQPAQKKVDFLVFLNYNTVGSSKIASLSKVAANFIFMKNSIVRFFENEKIDMLSGIYLRNIKLLMASGRYSVPEIMEILRR